MMDIIHENLPKINFHFHENLGLCEENPINLMLLLNLNHIVCRPRPLSANENRKINFLFISYFPGKPREITQKTHDDKFSISSER